MEVSALETMTGKCRVSTAHQQVFLTNLELLSLYNRCEAQHLFETLIQRSSLAAATPVD